MHNTFTVPETHLRSKAADLAGKKPALMSVYHGFALILTSTLFSLLQINRFSAEAMNADTALYPIMSLQNITLFIWGQNRFANIIPAVLSPLRVAWLNLAAHLLLFSLAFYLIIWLASFCCARFIFMSRKPLDVYILFFILVATFVALLRPTALYVFASEGQPYAWSYFLFGSAALLIFFQCDVIAWAMAALMLALAYGFNPSVMLAAAAVTLIAFIYQRGRAGLLFFALNAALFVLWGMATRKYPSPPIPYYDFDYPNILTNLKESLDTLTSVIRLRFLCLLGVVAGAIHIFRLSKLKLRESLALATGIAFALFSWVLFSNNLWIKTNGMHFRYFFPVFFIVGTVLAVIIWNWVRQIPPYYQVSIAAVCAVSVLGYFLRAPVPFEQYRLFRTVEPYVKFARENGIRFIAGDYWVVWPTVFRLLDTPDSAFGLTYRGDGNASRLRDALQSELTKANKVSLICLRAQASECAATAALATGQAWVPTNVSCGQACTILVTGR